MSYQNPTDAEIKAANLKHALYMRMVYNPENKAYAADYKRGYVIYGSTK
jgi:hypothetical protein